MFLLLSLNIFHTFLCVSFVEFEQVDVSWDYSNRSVQIHAERTAPSIMI